MGRSKMKIPFSLRMGKASRSFRTAGCSKLRLWVVPANGGEARQIAKFDVPGTVCQEHLLQSSVTGGNIRSSCTGGCVAVAAKVGFEIGQVTTTTETRLIRTKLA